jgi:hypothetical protein
LKHLGKTVYLIRIPDESSSSTTELIVEDFSNFKRARGSTPAPNQQPTTLRVFEAVPGLSKEDIDSMTVQVSCPLVGQESFIFFGYLNRNSSI